MNKQKQRQKMITIRYGIAPTRERQFQNGGVRVETVAKGIHGKALVNRYNAVHECALDVYLERKIITRPQYRAGLRFREAYHRSITCRTAERNRLGLYSDNTNDKRLTMSEKLIRQAHNTLDSSEMGTVIDVCGNGHLTWNPKALEKLRKGLGHLSVKWQGVAVEICEHKTK